MPVQGFTVTPVVSFPQLKVIVFDSNGFSIESNTGSRAFTPIPAFVPAQTLIL